MDRNPVGPVNVAARDVVDEVVGIESLGNGGGMAEREVVDTEGGMGRVRWAGGMKRDWGRGLRFLCG